ncbi:MAG: NUDIX hydrolase [Elusimicrobia bacterium]|nr:NUDIX hydrolase [Elusimicrobiota bacterium]
MLKKEKTLKKAKIYSGKIVNFYCDTVKLQNGKKAIREYITHRGAAAILPVLDRNKIILIRQYRYPVKKFMLEIPAGKLDRNETPLSCIKRELIEETGFKAGRIIYLLTYFPSCAISTEAIHLFAGLNLKPAKMKKDEDEFLEKIILPFGKALKMVKDKKITDSKTIIALLYWKAFLQDLKSL